MAEKRYLLTPGPTPVPPEVLAELAKPVIHHRERDFREIYERCLARLQDVYRTRNDVLMFTTSGTGAFESAVANLTSPGDRQLVLSAGNFGERWAGMASAFGADLVHARLEWGETPEPDDLRSALGDAGDVKVVYLTHSETSTGVVCDVQALAAVGKEAGALVVVDAVSSLGAVPLESDLWGIDVVVSGSQKALMCPPGLAFASVSAAALAAAANATAPRYVMDWERTRKGQAKLDAPFTPAVSKPGPSAVS
jgi:aspartate aminotransferase-like enzyme